MPAEVSESLHAGAVGVDEEDLRAAVLGERDGEPTPVRRPRGRAVAAAEVREHLPLPGRHRLDVDDGLPVLERHVGEPRAVRRPRRREQRLVRPDDRLRIAAVGVGDDELEAPALLGDVRDARREHAGVAGELLVDDVGDLVRGRAELRRRHHVGHRGELRLLDRVEQREADLDPPVAERTHRRRPRRRRRRARGSRRTSRPRRGSAAARCRRRRPAGTGRCAADRRRRCPEMPSGQVASFSNGTIAMGTVVPAPPTISMVSCARAGATARIRKAKAAKIRRRKWILCEGGYVGDERANWYGCWRDTRPFVEKTHAIKAARTVRRL